MSEVHLRDIESGFKKIGLVLKEKESLHENGVSGRWTFLNVKDGRYLSLVFDGIDDLETLPIQKSYGCNIEFSPKCGVYFAKVSKSWPSLLSEFIQKSELL